MAPDGPRLVFESPYDKPGREVWWVYFTSDQRLWFWDAADKELVCAPWPRLDEERKEADGR
jgi:hypothetical protein